MSKTDDQQWLRDISVTDPEHIVAKGVVTRVLAEYADWGTDPIKRRNHPFRVEDQETIVYTDLQGRRFMIEITAHDVTEEDDDQEDGASLLAADPPRPAGGR